MGSRPQASKGALRRIRSPRQLLLRRHAPRCGRGTSRPQESSRRTLSVPSDAATCSALLRSKQRPPYGCWTRSSRKIAMRIVADVCVGIRTLIRATDLQTTAEVVASLRKKLQFHFSSNPGTLESQCSVSTIRLEIAGRSTGSLCCVHSMNAAGPPRSHATVGEPNGLAQRRGTRILGTE